MDHYALMDLHLDQARHHQSHQAQQHPWSPSLFEVLGATTARVVWSPPKWLLGVADPNIAHRKRSTFYVLEECETEEGEHGFWVFDEETGEEGLTGLYTNNEFWVLGA